MILRAVLIFAAILLIAVGVQTLRLHYAKAELEALQREYASAQVDAVIRGAVSATDALENYVERQEQDRPVVERVVERVRNVCLRPADRVPVPASAGAVSGPAERAGDAEDRAREDERYIVAIQHDLAYCNEQLNLLRGLQQFCIANGCADRSQEK